MNQIPFLKYLSITGHWRRKGSVLHHFTEIEKTSWVEKATEDLAYGDRKHRCSKTKSSDLPGGIYTAIQAYGRCCFHRQGERCLFFTCVSMCVVCIVMLLLENTNVICCLDFNDPWVHMNADWWKQAPNNMQMWWSWNLLDSCFELAASHFFLNDSWVDSDLGINMGFSCVKKKLTDSNRDPIEPLTHLNHPEAG